MFNLRSFDPKASIEASSSSFFPRTYLQWRLLSDWSTLVFPDKIYFRFGKPRRSGQVLKTISRQLKQRLQIVFASDLSEINVN